jgi:predicted deacylase
LELFGKRVDKGEKAAFKQGVASYPNGDHISVTVRACMGVKDGPRLAMLGVQHGDEYSGMEIINRVMDDLNPRDLSGVLITVPVSNILAFNSAERITPPGIGYENLNMNRVWPGNHKGLLMERIVAQLWDNVVKGSDAVLDLHEGGRAFMARYLHARGTDETDRIVGDRVQKLYTWFGQGVPVLGGVRTASHMIGSLSVQAGLEGIPCLGPELGGGGRLWEELVQVGVQGVMNIMIAYGMVQEEPVGQRLPQHVAQESTWPKTKQGGVIYNSCELGDIVEAGTVLGELRDVGGRTLEKVKAPYRSVIFDTRYTPTVYPGDWTFHCGRLT